MPRVYSEPKIYTGICSAKTYGSLADRVAELGSTLRSDNHQRANADTLIQIGDVLVEHPNTAI
jgi:hypothetical protein